MCSINILLFLYVVLYTFEFQLKVNFYQRIPKNSNFPAILGVHIGGEEKRIMIKLIEDINDK